ncbi:MAG: CRISPR-associated protein Cas4 [Methanotrichaceae archaeon]
MIPLVRISDLGLYLRCPRLVYFEAMGRSVWNDTERPFNLLLRDLALSLSDLEPGSNLETWLRDELEKAEEDLPAIYRAQIDLHDLRAAVEETETIIPQMAENLASKLDLINPSETEVDLRSNRLGLSGRLDRLVTKNRLTPSIIRTGSPPENGVWRNDRIRLAGYALLLEEIHDLNVDQGFVEYFQVSEIRSIEIRSVDRRRVLRIRDRIKQIKDGRLPDRPKGAPCQQCPMAEECKIRRSLASKFF